MCGEMGWCGALECEMVPPELPLAVAAVWRIGMCGCPHPHLQKKKIGAPSNYPGARLFISPPHPDQK